MAKTSPKSSANSDQVARLERENAQLRAALQLRLDRGNGADPAFVAALPEESRSRLALRDWPQFAYSGEDPQLAFNATPDTRYAHIHPAFDTVLHIFAQDWKGIRAAAGSLPGQKLAVTMANDLSRSELAQILGYISHKRISRIIVHGFSSSTVQLIEHLAKSGLSGQTYVVYHGNVAQWSSPNERSFSLAAISVAERKLVHKIHFMRRDYPLGNGRSHVPMLLNSTPNNTGIVKTARRSESVLLPGTESWRKNIHANAMGAAMSSKVKSVLHYCDDVVLPQELAKKLKHARFSDRRGTMQLMANVDCTLNVSLVECHPMVALESEGLGTPCLRGPLHLDHGEDHPYVKLVEVKDPISPFEIRDALNRVLSVGHAELQDMLGDYTRMMNAKSISRYVEFLDL
ncbi:hypothetical protein [Aestuariivirga litoralis]|uniref:hypothetical protein n=1 Tax=Aestuariivirga litoralis TaxID=2650924 RepID=UPI0018C5C451|nr:hypothetical protein [Aestuariivirga litoralis]MBG1230793.1 hypothetical protein [Aestuariivirga litoralis]